MKLTIGHLYPDLLNLYGDRGNIQCLMKRCQWRGIEAKLLPMKSMIQSIFPSWISYFSEADLTGNKCWSVKN